MTLKENKDYLTINYDSFNINNLIFTDLTINKKNKNQLVGFPKYINKGTENELFIQFPWINLFTYGIPKIDPQYHPTDKSRMLIRLPLDENIHGDLINIFTKLDDYFESEEFKKQYFSTHDYTKSKYKKYKYNRCLKLNVNNDEDENEETKKVFKKKFVPSIKIRIDVNYNDDSSIKNIKTILYDIEAEKDTNEFNEYNIISRNKINSIESLQDFEKHVCWKSTVRVSIKPVKIWVSMNNPKDLQYGIIFKASKIEVIKPIIKSSVYKDYMENDNTFIDNKPIKTLSNKKSNNIESNKLEKKSNDIESDNSNNNSDDNSKEKSNNKQNLQNNIATVDSDNSSESDESDDSDESDNESKNKPLKTMKIDSDNDDIDSNKKSSQNPLDNSNSESESDSEIVNNKLKNTKKTVTKKKA